jgi:hypothetical protein
MKGLTAIALFCALATLGTLGTGAVAKPTPVERARPGITFDEADINISQSGPARERDYFQQPQAQFNAGGFVCRLPLIVFDKTRLASLCR